MEYTTCINISGYSHALTYGKQYEVIDVDSEKRQIKIRSDNNRVRWFPLYCFKMGTESVLRVVSFTIDDPIEDQQSAPVTAVEVTLMISLEGVASRRWCYFLTPEYARNILRDNEPLILGGHTIFLPRLSRYLMESSVHYMETHNLIYDHTKPLGVSNDTLP